MGGGRPPHGVAVTGDGSSGRGGTGHPGGPEGGLGGAWGPRLADFWGLGERHRRPRAGLSAQAGPRVRSGRRAGRTSRVAALRRQMGGYLHPSLATFGAGVAVEGGGLLLGLGGLRWRGVEGGAAVAQMPGPGSGWPGSRSGARA